MIREPYITDHALVRYLQRVCGVDTDAIRAQIARELAPAVAMGCVRYEIGGMAYVISTRGEVITVKPSSPAPPDEQTTLKTEQTQRRKP